MAALHDEIERRELFNEETVAGLPLTEEILKESTGKEELEDVTDVELIFTPVHRLEALDRCVRLRSLTLISTSLQSLEGLFPVRKTLLRLCITGQKTLRSIGRLDLPFLRDLLLHNNSIESIEGLDGVPRIQRLWLFSNRIRSMRGLHAQQDLRELWLQDNLITRIAGVEHLVSLQVLNVAANPITDLRDIQKLTHLPNLQSISLSDPHFGSCPITAAEGYRSYLLTSLPRLRQLDGEAVDEEDRAEAADLFLERSLQLGRAVDQMARQHERRLLALRARRQRNRTAAQACRRDLTDAFGRLERVIRGGQARAEAEQLRLARLRSKAGDKLRDRCETLEHAYNDWVARADAADKAQAAREEAAFAWLIRRSQVEQAERAAWAAEKGRGMLVHALSEHSPPFRALAQGMHRAWEAGAPSRCDPSSSGIVCALQFAPSTASPPVSPLGRVIWVVGSRTNLARVVSSYPRKDPSPASGWRACSSLRGALELAAALTDRGDALMGKDEEFRDEEEEEGEEEGEEGGGELEEEGVPPAPAVPRSIRVMGCFLKAGAEGLWSGLGRRCADVSEALDAVLNCGTPPQEGMCWGCAAPTGGGRKAEEEEVGEGEDWGQAERAVWWRWFAWSGPFDASALQPAYYLTILRGAPREASGSQGGREGDPGPWSLATRVSAADPQGTARRLDIALAALEGLASGAGEGDGKAGWREGVFDEESGAAEVQMAAHRALHKVVDDYLNSLWHEAEPAEVEAATTEADAEYVELSSELRRLRGMIAGASGEGKRGVADESGEEDDDFEEEEELAEEEVDEEVEVEVRQRERRGRRR